MSTQHQHEAPEMPEPVEVSVHGLDAEGQLALIQHRSVAPGLDVDLLVMGPRLGMQLFTKYGGAPGGMRVAYGSGDRAVLLEVVSRVQYHPAGHRARDAAPILYAFIVRVLETAGGS